MMRSSQPDRMLSRPLVVFTLLLLAAPPAGGQSPHVPDTLSVTLADALARVSREEPRLAAARAAREMARAARGEALSERRNRVLPQVSASFGTQRVAQNQFTEIARRAGIPPTPAEELDPFSRVFASPNSRDASFRAAIRPFDGGVASARVDAARAGFDASVLAESQVRAALEVEIVTRYADVQLHRRLHDVADSVLRQAERTLALTRQAVVQGRTAEFEIWRVEAEVAALRPAQLDAQRNTRLAELALRQLLDLPDHTVLKLEAPPEWWSGDTLSTTRLTDSSRPRAADRRDVRFALREFDARERQAAAGYRAAWRSMLPVLDVTLTHQRLAYPLRNANWGGPYYPNTVLGVSFTLPLDFTGGSLTRVESAAAAVRLATAQRRDAERVHALEQLDTQAQLEASRLEWEAAVAGAESADKALQVARARHEVGRASLLELQDARVTWLRAMATRARAARDRMVIEARMARFDRLPLSSVQP